MGTSAKLDVRSLVALSFAALLAHGIGRAATQPVDLDALPANGAESMCSTNVLSPFPVQIENKVTNRSNGDAFTFAWPSAGPGGFSSSVTPGTTNGVGATWVWTTDQSIVGFTGNSCPTDACFAKTSGPDSLSGFCSDACLADATTLTVRKGATAGTYDLSWTGGTSTFTVYRGTDKIGVVAPANAVGTTNTFTFTDTPPASTSAFYTVRGVDCTTRKACATNSDCSGPTDGTCVSRGPFGVPGRSLFATDVTVSAASLTSSLITFFSPPKEVFRATSSSNAGGAAETLTNFSTTPVTVTVPAFPPGCCPANSDHPHQLRCGSECVDYLSDNNNCGGCGNICGDGTCCANGNCVSVCGEGQTFCDGECVYLPSDNDNCGECGNACGESRCCAGGTCHSLCSEGLDLCGDSCVDLGTDNANCGSCSHACEDGTCCDDGGCASLCPVGWTWCGGQCVDLRSDSANCGECGSGCDDGYCCNDSKCESTCPEGRVWCNGECVNLDYDPGNCGSCGHDCGKGCCDTGSCYLYECSDQVYPIGESCPNPYPTSPQDGSCPGSIDARAPSSCPDVTVPTSPAGECFGELPAPPVEDTPVCIVNESTTTIPPGGSATTCQSGGPLFKEVPTAITVCGDGIPGINGPCNSATTHVTTGTFNRLMPDPALHPGNAFVTPLAVHVVNDASGDGLIEPGESAGLLIELLNAGPMNITGAHATLSAPAMDLTGDGVSNPVGLTFGTAAAAYGTILGMAPATDCTAPKAQSATNATVFPVTVPLSHPGDTSHPLVLSVTGTVNGGPFAMDVPLSLGIADRCDPASGSGDFDGLDGLLSPMAKLVPEGDTVPFPSKVFNGGDTRPLKLRVGCGGVNVTNTMIDPPRIVGISEATRGPIDITFLNLNADGTPATNDFFYVENDLLTGPHWQYNLSTGPLGTGTFTLTIKIGGRKSYLTGFVLN